MSIKQFFSSGSKSRTAAACRRSVRCRWRSDGIWCAARPPKRRRCTAKTARVGTASSSSPRAARRKDVPVYLSGLGTAQAFYTARVSLLAWMGSSTASRSPKASSCTRARCSRASIARPFQAAFDQASATREKDVAQLANAKRDLDRYQSLAARSPGEPAADRYAEGAGDAARGADPGGRGGRRECENAARLHDHHLADRWQHRVSGIVDPGNIVHATDAGGHRRRHADSADLGRLHAA